jgi:hypothetical protein
MTTSPASLAPPIRHQFFDDNGDPLALGYLYSYEAGTSTPLATYSDSALSVPNDNPISLDASGRPAVGGSEVAIYLEAVAYKFVLTDADGVTVWSQDNVISLAAALASASSGYGDSLVSVKKSFTDSVATTQHEINEREICVFDFMTAAQIADVTADTPSLDLTEPIKAAIAAGIAMGGAAISFPGGVYLFSEDLRLNAGDTGRTAVLLVGDGPLTTELKWNSSDDPVIAAIYANAEEGYPLRPPFGLKGIGINMNGHTNAVHFTSVNEFATFYNYKIGNFTDTAFYVGDGDGSYNNSSHFLIMDGQIVPHSSGANYGFYFDNASRVTVIRTTFDTQYTNPLDTAIYNDGDQNVFIGVHAEDCGRVFHLEGGRGIIFESINAINPSAAKASKTFDGITGTFFGTVASAASSYTIISARDPNSYSHQADYFLRDEGKGITIPSRSALGGLYQRIESFPYGSIVVDGNNGYLEIDATDNGGDNDNLDVNGIGIIAVNMSQGDVVVGGLQNGIQGQIIHFIKAGASNTFTLEHNEGVGTQSILTGDSQDLIFSQYGGAVLRCGEDGGAFYVVSQENGCSHIPALADDATPTVKGLRSARTGGTTTITDLDDGVTGQIFRLIAEHSVTITDGTNIFLDGSVNFAMTSSDTLTLICKSDNKWYELERGYNGAVRANRGTATITSGNTSVQIAHGLGVTPVAADFTVIGTEDPTNTPGAIWISAIDETNATINVENDPGASNFDVSWKVDTR